MKANRASPGCASIEMLESRRFLSAAPVSVAAAMTPTPTAVHTHPSYPSILGTFGGAYATAKGQTGDLSITISSEGKTGKLGGTLTIVGLGTIGITGTVSIKGKFSIHGSAHHFSIAVGGTVSSDHNTLAGRFSTTAKHGSAHGTLTASKTVTV